MGSKKIQKNVKILYLIMFPVVGGSIPFTKRILIKSPLQLQQNILLTGKFATTTERQQTATELSAQSLSCRKEGRGSYNCKQKEKVSKVESI